MPPVHTGGAFCGSLVREMTFVHAEGAWCGCMVPAGGICPRMGAFLWMRRRNSCRLSTQRVLGVEVWCPQVAFVHGWGRFCGRGGDSRRNIPGETGRCVQNVHKKKDSRTYSEAFQVTRQGIEPWTPTLRVSCSTS